MDDLVNTYLAWKSGQFDNLESTQLHDGEVKLSVRAIDFFFASIFSLLLVILTADIRTYTVLDLSTLSVQVAIDDSSPNIALALRGYLGTAPLHPKTAVTFRALEAYRQPHRVCPKLSIDAQVQVFCHLHEVC